MKKIKTLAFIVSALSLMFSGFAFLGAIAYYGIGAIGWASCKGILAWVVPMLLVSGIGTVVTWNE